MRIILYADRTKEGNGLRDLDERDIRFMAAYDISEEEMRFFRKIYGLILFYRCAILALVIAVVGLIVLLLQTRA